MSEEVVGQERNFMQLLHDRWDEGRFVCVGLDTDPDKLPECVEGLGINLSITDKMVLFNKRIIDATRDVACAYKPNLAFYLRFGAAGVVALGDTIRHIRHVSKLERKKGDDVSPPLPPVPVILDGKWADIGNTNEGYAEMAFETLGVDAITVNPYLGQEALQPFLDYANKGIFVLCRTSNPGAGEFQDLDVLVWDEEAHYLRSIRATPGWFEYSNSPRTALYVHMAYQISRSWNAKGNCGVVVGATCPDELAVVRRIVGDMPILIPGIGAQGGDLEATVKAGQDSNGQGMIVNLSRSVLYASSGEDFAVAARQEVVRVNDLIDQYRQLPEEL